MHQDKAIQEYEGTRVLASDLMLRIAWKAFVSFCSIWQISDQTLSQKSLHFSKCVAVCSPAPGMIKRRDISPAPGSPSGSVS